MGFLPHLLINICQIVSFSVISTSKLGPRIFCVVAIPTMMSSAIHGKCSTTIYVNI